MSKTLTIALMVFAGAATACATPGGERKPAQGVLPPGLAEIVKAREKLKGYVIDVKSTYKPEEKQYQKAKVLYREAFNSYETWVTVVQSAIGDGIARDLLNDSQYQQLSKQAASAGEEFIDYTQSVTVQTKGIPLLSELFDWGIKIWNIYRDYKEKERKARATNFATLARWERWDEINPHGGPTTDAPPHVGSHEIHK